MLLFSKSYSSSMVIVGFVFMPLLLSLLLLSSNCHRCIVCAQHDNDEKMMDNTIQLLRNRNNQQRLMNHNDDSMSSVSTTSYADLQQQHRTLQVVRLFWQNIVVTFVDWVCICTYKNVCNDRWLCIFSFSPVQNAKFGLPLNADKFCTFYFRYFNKLFLLFLTLLQHVNQDKYKNHDLSYDLTSVSPRYGGTGVSCNNLYGSSPCGPDGICTDIVGGYTCKPLMGVFNDCAFGGCGPNAYCAQVSLQRKMCLCVTGYQRTEPYLPCTKTTKTTNLFNRTT